MKRFCIEYYDHNHFGSAGNVNWLYIYAWSEDQLRDIFKEYDIIYIREME